ncbi:hypothetical protein [Kibdelosporangium aridum]|uniref:hypothetical protein n=1 Tax=Kibdelosporangium aridum TaxID=2030 RepID=UPI0035ED92E6
MKKRRFVAAGVVVALTATTVWWSHDDMDRPAVQTPITQAPDEATALMAARRQGTQVEVAGLKTESSRFFANPSGTMTMRQSVVPERVKLGGEWVDIDPTLVKRADGRFEPMATAPGVVFSGGGNQPFARMGVGDWQIALTWPKDLPKPDVSGDTATYPEVLPGVDLRARVGREGFGHELVVKSKEAAADPALAKITFGLRVKGVGLKVDEQGALTATNAKGETVFSAPAATMWDSGEKKAAVGVAIGAAELTLTPDLALLTSPEAKLPITIDPQYSYHGVRQSGWTLVRSGWPNQTHWNMAPEDWRARERGVARVGKSPEDGNGSIDRTLLMFDTAPLAATVVNSAQLSIKQGWKWANTCVSDQVPLLDLFLIGGIGPGTTLNNQPNWFW